ncbi:MAG: DUF192 domain-containing protein [Flavobacteriales bacterium]|nr:DUF192 domain-containing protein [Flavobacteriales bacterium]
MRNYFQRPLFVALLLATSLFQACDGPTATDSSPERPRHLGPQFQKEGILHFISAEGDTLRTIDIEIADTESERTIGLMHRRSMPDTQGMLFIFEEEERRSFWMRNTLIGLDILYIRANGEIESIAKYTVPLDERSIPSKGPATFVLEVIEGFCDRYVVMEGGRVAFERTDAVQTQ